MRFMYAGLRVTEFNMSVRIDSRIDNRSLTITGHYSLTKSQDYHKITTMVRCTSVRQDLDIIRYIPGGHSIVYKHP